MSNQALSDRRAGLDVPLTTISLGIPTDQAFIGNTLLPSLMVPLSTATIPVWGTEAFRIREDKVGDFSEPDKLDVSLDKVTFEVDGHAKMAPISDRQQRESVMGPFKIDLDQQIVYTVRASMDLQREYAQSKLMTTTGNYSSTHRQDQNGLSRLWSDPTIDPMDDIIPMIETIIPNDSGVRPNTFWMGQEVWAALMLNPLVRVRIFGTTGPQPLPSAAQFGALIGIDRVLVGRTIGRAYNGTTTTTTKLWGKNAGLTWVPPTAGTRIPAFGYTVEQSVFAGGSQSFIRFRDELMGASGGEWVKGASFYTPVELFPDAGALFYNAVA
jgi:hypothetical protein